MQVQMIGASIPVTNRCLLQLALAWGMQITPVIGECRRIEKYDLQFVQGVQLRGPGMLAFFSAFGG